MTLQDVQGRNRLGLSQHPDSGTSALYVLDKDGQVISQIPEP